MTEEKEIQEYKDLLSEKILSAFPEQPEPAEQIDNLLEIEGLAETLRISQIDIIDILSQPTLDAIDVDDLIKEYDLQQNETRPRRSPKDIEERLKPYGISNLLWKQFHDDHYDAFDFPPVPKRSLSIPIDNGLSGAWAPNGYGKTFVFDHILKFLQAYQQGGIKLHEGREHELFSDFLTKCTTYLHHQNKSTTPLPYDGQREEVLEKRSIPFRQICFSVEALKDNHHTTDFFSVRIEIEYDYRGNFSNYSLNLLAPNVANIVVVEGNIKLPNWINSNYHLEQISYATLSTRGGNYSKWPGIALRKLLSLNVNYIEIPSLAYQPNAGGFVQENIKTIVNNLLDEFTSASYSDIEIDKHGLLARFSKEGGNRFLLEALNDLHNDLNPNNESMNDFNDSQNPQVQKEVLRKMLAQKDRGILALEAFIITIQKIETEINALINNDNEAWGIKAKIRTPIGANALDLFEKSPENPLPWKKLSFGQRNDLILQSTLLQYQHCYCAKNTEDQVVLVIDEPEAGRSESWVNQLMHKLSTHISTHPILILSHRGMVLESINPSGEYQIMHTVKPDIEEVDEKSFKDYGIPQSNFSTKAKQSFAFINAFVNHPNPEIWHSRWRVNFPKKITPSGEWMENKAIENQWILKPISIAEFEYSNIKEFVNEVEDKYTLSNQELLLELWDGRIWPSTTTLDFYKVAWQLLKTSKTLSKEDAVTETLVRGIHIGGLGLPQTIKLNFLLTHLPTSYPKSPKEESKNYHNKTIKELALTNGLKISNTRISNVRKTIALADLQHGADLFATNLNNFIAGLKVRLDSLQDGNPKMPTKNALEAYILQLECQLTNNPLITQLESQDEIYARQPTTGPNQQFSEEGFFGYLKTLGVKIPEQITQEISENPISITDLEDPPPIITPQMEGLETESVDLIIADPPYKKHESISTESLWDEAAATVDHMAFLDNVEAYRSKAHAPTYKKKFPMKVEWEAKVTLRLRDKEKHPTQANFDTTKYRWTQKTLIASIKEAEINDYAEELVLQLASRYADENDLDPDEKIWIRADAFKEAAREIADRDVSSRIYDDFDDECGQYMLIRADIHGYSCLTCNNLYDEKKFLI